MTSALFPSFVVIDGVAKPDLNVFVTAMASRTLRLSGKKPPSAMMDALALCRSPQGGFRFWPPQFRPGWAPGLPDDSDDTSLATLELYHSGHLSREECRRVAYLNLLRHRVRMIEPWGPSWRRKGVFKTWARNETAMDIIDCTAHANILALLATLDLLHLPGVSETCMMLKSALDFAGDDLDRAISLSPFYPTPAELVLALDHAVKCGVTEISTLAQSAAATTWGRSTRHEILTRDHRICCSPYGATTWFAPKLAELHIFAV